MAYNYTKLETMVSTPYKDINGRKIYEGDIVIFTDVIAGYDVINEEAFIEIENKAVVAFNNGRWELKNFTVEDTEVTAGLEDLMDNKEWNNFMANELLVVGNRYKGEN